MATRIAFGPLSEETEFQLLRATRANWHFPRGSLIYDFVRTNQGALDLQESNSQLQAAIKRLKTEKKKLIEFVQLVERSGSIASNQAAKVLSNL